MRRENDIAGRDESVGLGVGEDEDGELERCRAICRVRWEEILALLAEIGDGKMELARELEGGGGVAALPVVDLVRVARVNERLAQPAWRSRSTGGARSVGARRGRA